MTAWPASEEPIYVSAPQSHPDQWASSNNVPDANLYTEAELFVAGRLSTMPPFDVLHPVVCLPYARAALEALGDWEPTDSVAPDLPEGTETPSSDDHLITD